MSLLSTVVNNSSVSKAGTRTIIYGIEKQGKTTFCCGAPRPLLVPLEVGYVGMNVNLIPMLESFEQVMNLLDEIIAQVQAGQFPYQTLVFDSGTALERLIHDAVLRSDPTWGKGNKKALTLDSCLGGFGKARLYAVELWSSFLAKCDLLATRGMINIVITCHAFASKVTDPLQGEFDVWNVLLYSPKNNKSYGARELLTQWADLVGFLHSPFFISQKEGSDLAKGISANKGRMLAVNYSPSYIAGNRYKITSEGISIPLEKGWNSLANEIYSSCGLDYFNRDQ